MGNLATGNVSQSIPDMVIHVDHVKSSTSNDETIPASVDAKGPFSVQVPVRHAYTNSDGAMFFTNSNVYMTPEGAGAYHNATDDPILALGTFVTLQTLTPKESADYANQARVAAGQVGKMTAPVRAGGPTHPLGKNPMKKE